MPKRARMDLCPGAMIVPTATVELLPMPKKEQRKSVSRSVALTIPELEQFKAALLIRLLLHTHDGAVSRLSKGSSLGIAASLD